MESQTEVQELLLACSRLLEDEGVPPLGGRIFGVLLVSGRTLTLDEITVEAGASKASASSNSRMLERLGLIERVSPPGDRKDHYRVATRGVTAPLELLLDRLRGLRDLYGLVSSSRSPAPPEVRNRLRLDISFIEHLLETCEELSRQWEERTRGFSA